MARVAGSYETWVYEWSTPQYRHDQTVELIKRLRVKYTAIGKLLDVGCGNGTLTKGIMEALGLTNAKGVDMLGDKIENLAPGDESVVQVTVTLSQADVGTFEKGIYECTLYVFQDHSLTVDEVAFTIIL